MLEFPSRTAAYLSGWSLILLGAAIPISVPAVTLFSVAAILLGLLGGVYTGSWRTIIQHPIALAALALFGWLVIAALYGEANPAAALHGLRKYRELLLIPLLLPLFSAHPTARRWGLVAFITAMLFTLILSYIKGVQLWWAGGSAEIDAVVFKNRITQNTLMAVAVVWMVLQAQRPGRWRILWIVLIGLALIDMFFLVGGRTGQVVLFALAGLWGFRRYHWKGLAATALISVALMAAVYLISDVFRGRLDEAQTGIAAYQSGTYQISTALRLSFYRNAFALMTQRPLLGYGTGSFTQVYAAQVAGTPYPQTENAHNEYLMLGVQTGLIGVALFLYLLGRHAWETRRFTGETQLFAQAVVITMAVGCLLNSFLLDHTEGHLYAYLTALLFSLPGLYVETDRYADSPADQ